MTVSRVGFLPEVVNDVISGVSIDLVGLDVHVKFGDVGLTVLAIFKQLTYLMDDKRQSTEVMT